MFTNLFNNFKFTILFLENINVHAYKTDVLEDVIYEEEYQYQPTIDDNFEDDKIIVTIKEEYSAVNKVCMIIMKLMIR